ncbi:uncharacterized protein LOC108109435 [Drosophila eugracilis]|uniref:uncharacterized protein LOC108109435 n=1 Tax=Drosophila eugracilis TaxID=29029 RepID=UPI0007E79733|nr:uncharacterized protein LOC108109435 [Drosophila eugracilis]
MLSMAIGTLVSFKKYSMNLVSISQANLSGVVDISNVRLIGREHLANGTITLKEDLYDEHWSFSGQLFSDTLGDGNYKLLPFQVPYGSICQIYKKYRKYFSHHADYGTQTDFPIHMDVCPVPNGTYYMKNIGLNPENYPNLMQRGYFQANGTFYYDGQNVGVYTINVLLLDED